jgi:hypothetical protein
MISPTQSNITAALKAFLVAVTGLDPAAVVTGQQNRAAQPPADVQIVMTPILFTRLATNVDGSADVSFVGSIAGTVLTVEEMLSGAIVVGAPLVAPGVAGGTVIGNLLSPGRYQVSPNQTVSARTMSSGAKTMTQNAEVVVQLDFHSLDTPTSTTTAADLAQTVSTALRDEFGVSFFAGLQAPLNAVVPLHADNPKQVPFINESQQVEWRWSLDCCLQVQQVVTVPQQYADSAAVTVKDVSALYPP